MTLKLNNLYAGNRYILRKRIGSGGYGSVYLGENVIDNIQVAIKESEANTSEARERFQRERRIQTRLGGEHIVQVLHFDQLASSDCLILEYLEGGSLAEWENRSTLTDDQKAEVIADVLRGLMVAHEKGIVHRDIKDGNILLTGDGRAKIADFGVAHDPSEPQLTRTGVLVGTDDWMAPEQAVGMAPDARDDLYSVGLLFYSLLTNDAPKRRRLGWQPRLEPVDPRFSQIIRRATAAQRADRYQSAGEMLIALQEARGRPLPIGVRRAKRLSLESIRLLTDEHRVRTLFRTLGYPVEREEDFSLCRLRSWICKARRRRQFVTFGRLRCWARGKATNCRFCCCG